MELSLLLSTCLSVTPTDIFQGGARCGLNSRLGLNACFQMEVPTPTRNPNVPICKMRDESSDPRTSKPEETATRLEQVCGPNPASCSPFMPASELEGIRLPFSPAGDVSSTETCFWDS